MNFVLSKRGRLTLLAAPLVAASLPSASAAALWGGLELSSASRDVYAGVGLLPLPLSGTLGVQGELAESSGASRAAFSLGATLRDLHLPGTGLDAFAGAGLTFGNAAPYLEGGLRAALLGPLGVQAKLRTFPRGGELRVSVGAEVRF